MDINSFALGYSAGKKKGVKLNIAYGDTPPEDTSKLWVKTHLVTGVEAKPFDRFETLPAKYGVVYHCNANIEIDKKIYLISPVESTSQSAKKIISCYDIASGKFTDLRVSLPRSLAGATCAHYNGNVYIFGGADNGYSSTTKILRWNISSGNVEYIEQQFGNDVNYAACAVVGNTAYIFGGEGGNSYTTYNTIYAFNMETETLVKSSATLYSKRSRLGCVAFDGKIYVFGGQHSGSAYQNMQCFDPEFDTIVNMTSLPTKLMSMSCGCTDSKIYIFHGSTATQIAYKNVLELDPVANTMRELAAETGEKARCGCVVVDDVVYEFGGFQYDVTTYPVLDEVTTFHLKPKVENGSLLIESIAGSQAFDLISDKNMKVSMPIYGVYVGNPDGVGDKVEIAIYKDDSWTNI